MNHVPVLLQEILEIFDPKPGKVFIDGTANGGGHTRALAELGAKVLAIEWDKELYEKLSETIQSTGYANSVIAVHGSYADVKRIARENDVAHVDGVLLDLGFSSWHVEAAGRGFSFQKDEPLDMRYDISQHQTAADIVNTYSEEDLARILKEYGEERFDGRIASAIVGVRPITTTFQLVQAIERVVRRTGKIHPATRTFQALRIAVNHELENVQKGIEGAWEVLKPEGELAVISFHSLEDRIVKNYFKKISKTKVIRARWEEIKTNRRARSAKLRVVERTTPAT
ncbi:MAG: 16S rRNA (cytosine(1402)-N(4))-methyltransferase RsmH [Patescibacteria group bacterium]